MKVRKAVIPAAGLGTRFLPATKAQPKEMIPIVDKPAIQYIVEEAVESGIEDILIITGRGKRAIEDHFDKSFELDYLLREKEKQELLAMVERIEKLAKIHYIRQVNALGLGHAILQAKYHVGNEPFAVLLGDDIMSSKVPATKQLIEAYEKYNNPIISLHKIPVEEISSYGVIKGVKVNDIYIIEDLIEKPKTEEAPSDLAISGRYILDSDIFPILEELELKLDKNKELQITDALRLLNKRKQIYGYELQSKWHTVGDKLSYLKTVVEMALEREDIGEDFKEYLLRLALKVGETKPLKISTWD